MTFTWWRCQHLDIVVLLREIERDLGLDREDIEQCVRDMDKRSQISAKIDSVGGEIIVTPKVNDMYAVFTNKYLVDISL